MPFFSIVIPLYNKEHFIVQTIQSVLDQTFQDYEILVVNDGSTDASLNSLRVFNDSRIQVFTIKNQGVSHARNFGIKKANAKYVAFLDADDLWLNKHLEQLKKLSEDFPNCGLYANAYVKKMGEITLESHYIDIPNAWNGIVKDYFKSSQFSCVAWTSAVMVPKKILEAFNGFDERITLGAGEDTDLWMKIAIQHPIAFNNNVTAVYNLHADNRISNANTNLRQFLDLDVYEEAAKSNTSLKKYLDFNRFSIALQYKLVGNKEKMDFYLKHLNKHNLNAKQRFILSCNKSTLVFLMKTQKVLRQFHVNLSPFK